MMKHDGYLVTNVKTKGYAPRAMLPKNVAKLLLNGLSHIPRLNFTYHDTVSRKGLMLSGNQVWFNLSMIHQWFYLVHLSVLSISTSVHEETSLATTLSNVPTLPVSSHRTKEKSKLFDRLAINSSYKLRQNTRFLSLSLSVRVRCVLVCFSTAFAQRAFLARQLFSVFVRNCVMLVNDSKRKCVCHATWTINCMAAIWLSMPAHRVLTCFWMPLLSLWGRIMYNLDDVKVAVPPGPVRQVFCAMRVINLNAFLGLRKRIWLGQVPFSSQMHFQGRKTCKPCVVRATARRQPNKSKQMLLRGSKLARLEKLSSHDPWPAVTVTLTMTSRLYITGNTFYIYNNKKESKPNTLLEQNNSDFERINSTSSAFPSMQKTRTTPRFPPFYLQFCLHSTAACSMCLRVSKCLSRLSNMRVFSTQEY